MEAGQFWLLAENASRDAMLEALREQQARFQDLYENAPHAYFSVGIDGLIIRCNKRAGELLGCPAEELVGKPVFELYADTPQGKEKAARIFRRFRAGERISDEKLQMQKADGTLVWIGLTVNAIRDAAGQIVESRSMAVDITERKRAEEELHRYAEEQSLLYTVASTVAALPGVEESLSALLDLVLPLLNSDAGWVTLPGPTLDDPPQIVAWRGISETFIEAEMATPLRNCPVCAPLLAGGQAQIEPALIARCPRLPPEVLANANMHSHVAIPLSADDRVLGILEIAWRAPRPYMERERSLLIAIGQQMGVALENMRLHQQSRKLAVMEERYRLSREMHDGLAQTLGGLGWQLDHLKTLLADGRLDALEKELALGRQMVREAYMDVREAIDSLRLDIDQPGGLTAALRECVADFQARTGTEATLEISEDGLSLPAESELQLLRIVQEALTNVRKHAVASHVRVRLQYQAHSRQLTLTVSDDGRGFDPAPPLERGHLGLTTMRERAQSQGGEFAIITAPGQGTRITVTFSPVPKAA